MKVLYVINGLGTGGAERSLAEMLPLLVERGVEPTVVCLYRRHEGVERSVIDAGIPVEFVDSTRLPTRVAQLRRLLKQRRPDLVHTTIFESDLVGRLASAGTSIPVLTSLVNTPYDSVRLQDPNVSPRVLAAVRLLDGWTARRFTDHFHAITQAVKEATVRDLGVPADSITVIERGRDPARLGAPNPERRRRARRQLALQETDTVLVTVGRQEFQKGQRYLLEAMPRLVQRHPQLVLLIAGRKGNATRELEQLTTSTGVSGQVRFLGHRDDVPNVLAAGDLFVFPSLYEGLGGALIEAMALGLPIIASDISVLRETLESGTNALLVSPGSPDALVEAIDRLLNDAHMRHHFSMQGRAIFQKRFTMERCVDGLLELYLDVARAGPDSETASVRNVSAGPHSNPTIPSLRQMRTPRAKRWRTSP